MQPLQHGKVVGPLGGERRLELIVCENALGGAQLGQGVGHRQGAHDQLFQGLLSEIQFPAPLVLPAS